jgi:hypothetical protein
MRGAAVVMPAAPCFLLKTLKTQCLENTMPCTARPALVRQHAANTQKKESGAP